MKTYYLDYCRDRRKYRTTFRKTQQERENSFPISEMDEIVQWGYDDASLERNIVDTDFYQETRNWIGNKRSGYYAWKPYIIYDLLNSIDDGDIVVYWDCNPFCPKFNQSFMPFLNYVDENFDMVVPSPKRFLHIEWTKRDCFELMGCTDEKYTSSANSQIQATWSIWKKTPKTMDAVSDWLYWSKNENVIRCDLTNICGKDNFQGFNNHRHDQSVLTNIVIKHKCTIVSYGKNMRVGRRKIKDIHVYSDNYAKCKFGYYGEL